jgi:RND family efflux transporter MFP subunit
MTRAFVAASVFFVAACSGGAAPAEQAAPVPVASVGVAPLERRVLDETIHVYGLVVSGPAGGQTLSVPYESMITQILVREGQQVAMGDPIIAVGPSPDARLSVAQASSASTATHATLLAVQERYAQHLATQQEMQDAQQASRSAELQLQSLSVRGAAVARTLSAAGPAVVASIHVTSGAIVAAGSPLVDLDLRDHHEARFGVEVEDVRRIQIASTMDVSDLEIPPAVTVVATVRTVSDSVDSATGLVDLFAALPADATLLLGQHVTGSLTLAAAPSLVTQRSAVLPVDDHLVVFTVRDGHAHAHIVRLGLETDSFVEIIADEPMAEGDAVVVHGAQNLEDGMQVTVEDAGAPGVDAGTAEPAEHP